MIQLFANDQLRQRNAWALYKIFNVAILFTDDRSNNEGHLHYYDIFVRNAFGNYFDVLKEAVFSTELSEQFSYRNNFPVRNFNFPALEYPDEVRSANRTLYAVDCRHFDVLSYILVTICTYLFLLIPNV